MVLLIFHQELVKQNLQIFHQIILIKMAKKISKELTESSNKIHEIGNKLLSMDGHEGYKVAEI